MLKKCRLDSSIVVVNYSKCTLLCTKMEVTFYIFLSINIFIILKINFIYIPDQHIYYFENKFYIYIYIYTHSIFDSM